MPHQFEELSLSTPLLRALTEEGYEQPTPVQRAAIPEVLDGNDVLAAAQTGTGKTAAFTLPMLQLLQAQKNGNRPIRGLILTPTRELALQVAESLSNYGRHLPLRATVLLGGVSAGPQIAALRKRPDILVATPGTAARFVPAARGQTRWRGNSRPRRGGPHARHGFFARRPPHRLGDTANAPDVAFFGDPCPRTSPNSPATCCAIRPASKSPRPLRSPEQIDQKVFFVAQEHKRNLLTAVLKDEKTKRALVFTRTKHRANRLTRQLRNGGIEVEVMHSNKGQGARQAALKAFDLGRVKVLVATDIAARGIDVDAISHVINYEMPIDPESYVHRIGRTARAGCIGMAMSFCNAEEVGLIKGIERLTRSRLVAEKDHPFHSASIAALRPGQAPEPARTERPEPRRQFGRSTRKATRRR